MNATDMVVTCGRVTPKINVDQNGEGLQTVTSGKGQTNTEVSMCPLPDAVRGPSQMHHHGESEMYVDDNKVQRSFLILKMKLTELTTL